LKKTSAWKYSQILKNFDEIRYNINYIEFLEFSKELNSLMNKEITNLNFNIYNTPKSIKDCKKIIRGLKLIFHKKANYFQSKLLKIIDEVISDVSMIESCYIEVDESLLNQGKIPYILKFEKYLERESKINKIIRESSPTRKESIFNLCWYNTQNMTNFTRK
jgi:hypothetical protein